MGGVVENSGGELVVRRHHLVFEAEREDDLLKVDYSEERTDDRPEHAS